jgi:two-component system CheB/CheR fusion protein
LNTATSEAAVGTAPALLARALAQAEEHALILLDADARVVTWFRGATAIFGYEPVEMIGETLQRLLSADDITRGELELELRTASSYGKYDIGRWHVRKDGVPIWATGTTTAVRDDDGAIAGFITVMHDSTDIRSHLDTLQARLDVAARAENERHVVLGTLAHELRQPLGPLRHAAHAIRLLAGDRPQVNASLEIIERQVRYIVSVVEDLLESTRVGVGKTELHCEKVQLAEVVGKAVETCSLTVNERMQRVEVLLADELVIEVDPVRLQQVLVNLIQNASKFSPPHSSIWVKATVDSGEVVLRVEDEGQGVPAELLPKIFDLFTQARPDGCATERGLGLGLGLVKSLVELHGGTVQAKSEGAGKGTEMVVRLPMERSRVPQYLNEGHV